VIILTSEDVSAWSVEKCERAAQRMRELSAEYERAGYQVEAKNCGVVAKWWADQAKAKGRSHER
jgi:hypothetical protein